MKLLVLSDLHLEGAKQLSVPPTLSFDVAVLAGDITTPGRQAVDWAQQTAGIADRPAVLVAGNHEFYGAPDLRTELHHAPSIMSVAPRYEGDRLSPAFVSDLPDEFFDVPSVWIHGHTHSSADYVRGRCRVVSNPRGYPLAGGGFENARFDPGFVVDLVGH